MSRIFDFFEIISGLFRKFFEFITQMFSLLSYAVPIIHDLISSAVTYVPVLSYFFMLFLSFAVVLFIWRLIP